MLKISTKLRKRSATYWSQPANREAQSARLQKIQNQRQPELSAAAKQSWIKHRDTIISGIRKANTPAKRLKISESLSKHWTNKLSKLQESFINKAIARHGNDFNYDDVKYVTYFTNVVIRCNRCFNLFDQTPSNHLRGSGCPYCHISQGHREICETINEPCKINDRQSIAPYEIDILYQSHKVGVEFHGMYWHSNGSDETTDDRLYHQRKWAIANKSGIHLLQFYEHEWTYRKHIVESMIKYRLGQTTKLNARDLTISTNTDSSAFMEANHLQGNRTAKHHFTLLDNNTIVMAATLSGHKDGGYELIRMATKTGICVRGGVSKLFKNIANKFPKTKITTYADLRYATATGYTSVGFKAEKVTKPGYFYCKGLAVLSRQQCQKQRLHRILPVFNPELSEFANMVANGYRRMWDAGHLRLSLIT